MVLRSLTVALSLSPADAAYCELPSGIEVMVTYFTPDKTPSKAPKVHPTTPFFQAMVAAPAIAPTTGERLSFDVYEDLVADTLDDLVAQLHQHGYPVQADAGWKPGIVPPQRQQRSS